MKFADYKVKAIIYFVIGSILVILFFYLLLNSSSRTLFNFISLYGTYATLYGITIAYLQIQSLKVSNIKTTIAVGLALNRINQILSISDLSKANKIIEIIQNSIINLKYELALNRMKDLKNILLQIKNNGDLQIYTNDEIYSQHISNLGIDIGNINALVIGQKTKINSANINNNLEDLSTVLSELENQLKFQRNDT